MSGMKPATPREGHRIYQRIVCMVEPCFWGKGCEKWEMYNAEDIYAYIYPNVHTHVCVRVYPCIMYKYAYAPDIPLHASPKATSSKTRQRRPQLSPFHLLARRVPRRTHAHTHTPRRGWPECVGRDVERIDLRRRSLSSRSG